MIYFLIHYNQHNYNVVNNIIFTLFSNNNDTIKGRFLITSLVITIVLFPRLHFQDYVCINHISARFAPAILSLHKEHQLKDVPHILYNLEK